MTRGVCDGDTNLTEPEGDDFTLDFILVDDDDDDVLWSSSSSSRPSSVKRSRDDILGRTFGCLSFSSSSRSSSRSTSRDCSVTSFL